MKEELMRRISSALDTEDGVAGDPALQEALRADPEAAKYAKDATRVGKWLAVWPLPEPDDAAFEALAARIEQRLDEELPKIADPTEAPSFDDDDALRDATAGLLESGEFRVSEPGPVAAAAPRASDPDIPLLSDPGLVLESDPGTTEAPSDAGAPAAIARVSLSKKRAPVIVEESSGTGEPLSSAELELRLAGKTAGAPPAKKKKKKKAAGATTTSSDRISIPSPKPALSTPTLAPVKELPRAEDRKGPSPFWWFAAAAAVGIGVFGAASLFESSAEPSARGSTLVTTGAIAPAAPPAPPPYVAPVAATTEAPPVVVPPATVVAAAPVPAEAETVVAADIAAQTRRSAEPEDVLGGEPSPVSRGARARPTGAALAPSRVAGGGLADDDFALDGRADRMAEPSAGPAAHRSTASGSGSSARSTPTVSTTPSPTTATTSAPTPPPATAAAEASAPLPSTPDRSTIQTILEGRADAVRACAAGAHGLADVDVVIAGSGRITTATVNGTFAGTPVGSCIARAVRGATFPPFSQARFEVTYPYHL